MDKVTVADSLLLFSFLSFLLLLSFTQAGISIKNRNKAFFFFVKGHRCLTDE